MVELTKREWCYCQSPAMYDIACDLCNGMNNTWSEYEHLIWCYDCQKDTPGNGGIFNGPIGRELSKLLGISFNRIEIATGDMLYMHDTEDGHIYYDKNSENCVG